MAEGDTEVQIPDSREEPDKKIRVSVSPETLNLINRLLTDNYIRNRIPYEGLDLAGWIHWERERNIGGWEVGGKKPYGTRIALTEKGLVGEYYSSRIGLGGSHRFTDTQRGQRFTLEVLSGETSEIVMTPQWSESEVSSDAETSVQAKLEKLEPEKVTSTLVTHFQQRFIEKSFKSDNERDRVPDTGFMDQEQVAIRGSILEGPLTEVYRQLRESTKE